MNVSFVIPSWNYGAIIHEAIGSIMDENLEEGDEIVVCDDCSTDNSVEVLTQLQRRWPIIKVIQHPERRGGGATYNTAIRHSRNPLLFSLDADNVLISDSVPHLKQFLVENNADVAAFRGMYYFGSLPEMVCWPMDVVTLEHHLSGASIPGFSGNYMFTKEIWEKCGGFPENTWLDSWGFDFRMAAVGAKIVIMPSLYYRHRRGHYSAYMRGLDRSPTSQAAFPVIEPYLDLLDERDVEYIIGEGRDVWYDTLKERPLRLRRNDEDIHSASGGGVPAPAATESLPAA